MNKEQMNNTAMKSGLNVAPSIAVEYKGTEDSLNEVKKIVQNSSIGYPIIIKPLYSYSGSKEMIRICNNPEELCFVISKNRVGKFLIQKYIQVIKEVGIQGVIGYDSSDVQIPGIVHKIRKAVSAQGSTTYAELNDDFLDINLENIKEFIRNIGFKGIFDIEMVSDGNDYYFIEFNFRNGAYGYAYTRGGANLPLYWYNSCFGNIEHLKNINSLKYMNESADFAHVKCGEISLFKWIGEFIATDTKAIVNFKDPKPFLAKLRFWH
jgi:predicted ATP-grasp superfamily ATP-dependent carboligase